MGKPSDVASVNLDEHMKRYRGQLLTHGTFASDEFDRLYLVLRRALWDEGDPFTREVWRNRP